MRIIFDNDAASLLFGNETASSPYPAARDRLREDVKLGRTEVLVPGVLLNELAGKRSRDPRCYQLVIRELRELSGGRIMLGTAERIPLEAARGGLLPAAELFYPPYVAKKEWDLAVRSEAAARRVDDEIHRQKAESRSRRPDWKDQLEARISTLQISPDKRKSDFQKILMDWRARVREWCLGSVRDGEYGIQPPSAPTDPEKIPTLWSYVAFQIVNYVQVHLEGWRADEPVEFDAIYYADGAYADYLVTNDGRFRKTAASLTGNRPTCCSLDEFLGMPR